MSEDRTKRILLVEDNAILAMNEERILKEAGYVVEVAHSGEAAVDSVAKGTPIDLVLMDIDLGSGIDGVEAASRILESRELPVVFLTSHSEKEMVDRVKGVTRYGYVLKSSGEFVLLESVSMAFDLFEAHSRLSVGEAEYRALFDGAANPIVIYDVDGTIRNANEMGARILGVSVDDIVGRRLSDLVPPPHQVSRERLQECVSTGSSGEYVEELAFPGGERRLMRSIFRPLDSPKAGTSRVQVISYDITEEKRAMDALALREERYRLVVNNMSDFVILMDDEARIVFASENAPAYLGIDPESLVGRSAFDLVNAEDRESFENAFALMRDTDDEIVRQGRTTTADGHVLWMEARGRRVTLKHGTPQYVVAVKDISLRKKHEDARQAADELFSTVFRRAPLLMSISSIEDGTYLDVNDTFVRVTGYTREETIGTRSVDLGFISAPDRERLRAQILETGRVEDMWLALTRKDGEALYCRYFAEVIEVEGQKRLLSLAIDVTRQGDARGALDGDQHYLRDELLQLMRQDPAIFDFIEAGSLDGVWYWDIESSDNEWMSPRFWKTLGYNPSEKRHDPVEWQDLIFEEDLNVALDNFQKHLEDAAHPYDQVVRYRHREGGTVWVRCRGIAIRDGEGRPLRMLGAHNDITQLKETELQLRQLIEEKTTLMREVHHRVKNNLAMVSSLLSLKEETLAGVADLSDIQGQVSAIFTAYDMLSATDDATAVDLGSYVENLLAPLEKSYPSLRLSVDISDVSLPGQDAVTFGLIVNELATNALKHGRQPGEEMSLSVDHAFIESEGVHRFRVVNSGRPVPDSVDLNEPTTLGLRLVSTLVRQLGGTLTLHREPTTFSFSIPEV
jgi:PAS domain S-box-containing protein